ncbi:unnamed protein product, partial [Prorocentrum cordatum]
RWAPCVADAAGVPVEEARAPAADAGICLAVGDESRGVGPELLRACERVALPMSELVDSLNAGVAGGILMHSLACAWVRRRAGRGADHALGGVAWPAAERR